MSSNPSQPAPSLDVVLTLIDAHAAASRAIALHWFLRTVSEIGATPAPGCDTTLLELEFTAAQTEVRMQSLKLLQMVDANRAWINAVVGPWVTERLTEALPAACEWIPLQDEDFASYWASRLTGLVAGNDRPTEPCGMLEAQFHVDGALCALGNWAHCGTAQQALEQAIHTHCGEPQRQN